VTSGFGKSGIGLCGLSRILKAAVSSELSLNSIGLQSYHVSFLFSSQPL